MADIKLNAQVTINPDHLETLLRHAYNRGWDERDQRLSSQVTPSNKIELMRQDWENSETVRDMDEIIKGLNASIQVRKTWR